MNLDSQLRGPAASGCDLGILTASAAVMAQDAVPSCLVGTARWGVGFGDGFPSGPTRRCPMTPENLGERLLKNARGVHATVLMTQAPDKSMAFRQQPTFPEAVELGSLTGALLVHLHQS